MDSETWAKFSFLPKNQALSSEQFQTHYRNSHGPLAAGLSGFQKYTARYEQNHVTSWLSNYRLAIDGITKTWQRPRVDYSVGFFNEADYELVKSDEQYLFEVNQVVSVLAKQLLSSKAETSSETIKLLGINYSDLELPTLQKIIDIVAPAGYQISGVDLSTATALGFGKSSFTGRHVIELWFEQENQALIAAAQLSDFLETKLDLWQVSNYLIYQS